AVVPGQADLGTVPDRPGRVLPLHGVPRDPVPGRAFRPPSGPVRPRVQHRTPPRRSRLCRPVPAPGPAHSVSHSAAGPHAITAMARDRGKVAAQVLLDRDRIPDPAGIDIGRVAAVPHMFIWGDFINEDPSGHWEELRQSSLTFAEALRDAGGEVAWIDLPAEG